MTILTHYPNLPRYIQAKDLFNCVKNNDAVLFKAYLIELSNGHTSKEILSNLQYCLLICYINSRDTIKNLLLTIDNKLNIIGDCVSSLIRLINVINNDTLYLQLTLYSHIKNYLESGSVPLFNTHNTNIFYFQVALLEHFVYSRNENSYLRFLDLSCDQACVMYFQNGSIIEKSVKLYKNFGNVENLNLLYDSLTTNYRNLYSADCPISNQITMDEINNKFVTSILKYFDISLVWEPLSKIRYFLDNMIDPTVHIIEAAKIDINEIMKTEEGTNNLLLLNSSPTLYKDFLKDLCKDEKYEWVSSVSFVYNKISTHHAYNWLNIISKLNVSDSTLNRLIEAILILNINVNVSLKPEGALSLNDEFVDLLLSMVRYEHHQRSRFYNLHHHLLVRNDSHRLINLMHKFTDRHNLVRMDRANLVNALLKFNEYKSIHLLMQNNLSLFLTYPTWTEIASEKNIRDPQQHAIYTDIVFVANLLLTRMMDKLMSKLNALKPSIDLDMTYSIVEQNNEYRDLVCGLTLISDYIEENIRTDEQVVKFNTSRGPTLLCLYDLWQSKIFRSIQNLPPLGNINEHWEEVKLLKGFIETQNMKIDEKPIVYSFKTTQFGASVVKSQIEKQEEFIRQVLNI